MRHYYTQNARPLSPLNIGGLPRNIRERLETQRLDTEEFSTAPRIDVPNAYYVTHIGGMRLFSVLTHNKRRF